MTSKRRTHVASIALIVLGYLVGIAAYPFIPGNAIDHMRGARAQIAFSLPTAILVIHLIFRSLWRHDRIRTGNGAFEATYHAIVFRTMLFVFAMNALLMLALTDAMDVLGSHTWGKRVVVVMLGLTFMAIGNLLPRTRPNIAFGVRTARTLANTQLWLQVHRVGGYTTVALGAAILIAGLVVTNSTAGGFVLLAGLIAAIIVFISYRKYANA
jgi:immunity protein, SdpI family